MGKKSQSEEFNHHLSFSPVRMISPDTSLSELTAAIADIKSYLKALCWRHLTPNLELHLFDLSAGVEERHKGILANNPEHESCISG
jgi:hypothetical protein